MADHKTKTKPQIQAQLNPKEKQLTQCTIKHNKKTDIFQSNSKHNIEYMQECRKNKLDDAANVRHLPNA